MFLIVLIVCSNVIFIILSLSLKMKIKQSIVFPTLLMSRFKRDCVDTWYNIIVIEMLPFKKLLIILVMLFRTSKVETI